eukprot:CAMPEP_0172528510 /NCGR_PEP_ID=MMETSP1067-20121228/2882_1 /TAXON_ID=265564 ORGANISM="Thalassiosira punctigera, Strain Tpunct2005C2" /NCGR_SAMPLE_ID=MMETSP1067 /ASSEMBLY_ACC=CAM_ASM_000444 /LENGTH=338 /DNA_ID=CAMNT_0013312431 /DNA_START=325 /DNA_END=1341 /DNA_ORIENTATION=+
MAPFYDSLEEKLDSNLELEYLLSTTKSAVDRIRLVVDHFGHESVTVLTSFGVQSGIMLSLVAEACPEVRVLYIDTQGPTSERDLEYGRKLLSVLGLKNFTIAKAGVTREEFSAGMQEVGISESNDKHVFHKLSQDVFKVAPLKRECARSNVKCLLSGVRRGQTSDRDGFDFVQFPKNGPAKGHPILDWHDDRCIDYLRFKDLPPHPELGSVLEVVAASPRNALDGSRRSSFRSRRAERAEGKECGIHVENDHTTSGTDPVPIVPNVVVGRVKCKFCKAAKELLSEKDVDYVEAPVTLFPHLVPPGTRTVPVIYLDKQLIGGYGNLCEYLGVEDQMNDK